MGGYDESGWTTRAGKISTRRHLWYAVLSLLFAFSFPFSVFFILFYRADFSFAVSDSRCTLGSDVRCARVGAVGCGGALRVYLVQEFLAQLSTVAYPDTVHLT
jgi:hypothetical protein